MRVMGGNTKLPATLSEKRKHMSLGFVCVGEIFGMKNLFSDSNIGGNMSRYFAGAVLLTLLAASAALSQGTSAQLGGVVTDQSGALIPGVTITVTNVDTGIVRTGLTNEAGAYTFPSLQPGTAYQVRATLPGFRTNTVNNLELSGGVSVRQNFRMEVSATATTVEVQVDQQGALAASSASVGDVLPEYRIRNLPLVGNNVLDLLDILPGLRLSPIGSGSNTIGGLGIDSINVTRDGLTLTDQTFSAQGGTLDGQGGFFNPTAYSGDTRQLSTTTINPDLVGEIRLILSPVDAELGRGNSQIQIQTRSGTNRFTGSAVWNIQNTALNANTWGNNNDTVNGVWTPTQPDWRNNNQYTISFGGPIIRNKTFFYALWDQNISNTRQLQQNRVLTDEARNGIFRFWEGWVADSGDPANNPTSYPVAVGASIASVDDAGKPLMPEFWPNGTPYTGRLVCFSVFGNVTASGTPFTANDCPSATDSRGNAYVGAAMFPSSGSSWDLNRPGTFNSAGYFAKILAKMPHPNDFINDTNGDGLVSANFRWLLGRSGNNTNSSITGSEAYSNRKQINIKVDQNFGMHRIAGSWTYQRDNNVDNVGDWPDGLSGQTYRRPHVFTVNVTSTLSSTLLNEGRFGLNLNQTNSVPAWLSPDAKTAEEARSFLENGGTRDGVIYPVVVAPTVGTGASGLPFNTGVMETTTGVTQIGFNDPLYNFADTLSWTRGKHAFKFGADLRYPRSKGYSLQPYPVATYGNVAGSSNTVSPFGDAGQTGQLGATTGTSGAVFPQGGRDLAANLAYLMTDSIGSIRMPYWIENHDDVAGGVWQDTTTRFNQYRETVSSDYAFFGKDDYKLTPSLTLNLGLRYEYYSSPYVRSGLTSTTLDQGNGLFGASRSANAGGQLFDSWLQPGALYLTGYGNNAASLAPGTSFLDCKPGVQQSALLPVSTCDPSLITDIEFVGPNSPNPNKTVVPRDRNNFGPAVGFAWQVPWFGEGRTTVRGGYQVTFSRTSVNQNTLASALGGSLTQNLSANDPNVSAILATRALQVSDIPALVPLAPSRAPGQAVPIYARSASTASYDPNFVAPYTQNLTLSVTRSLRRNMTLDVRWVGTLARKMPGTLNVNENTVMYNPELFDALEQTRLGQNVALFDEMFAGLRLAGVPSSYGTVNGTTSRGSEQLRLSTSGGGNSFATLLANGNLLGVANSLLSSNPAAGLQGNPAGLDAPRSQVLLRNGCDRLANGLTNIATRCFPENYLIANPQLNSATYNANLWNSNYHALQVQFSLRPTQGISFQSTYSWAKSMQNGQGAITDPLMRDLDRARGREGPHSFRMNGTFELPIGPNKLLFANASGWVARLIERWQTSFILNMASGSPADILGAQSMRYGNGRYVVASPEWKIPKGTVVFDGPSGTYYGDTFASIRDPQCDDPSLVAASLASRCTLTALAMRVPAGTANSFELTPGDPTSTAVYALVNPAPGELGTLGMRTLEYWGQFSLDANAQKTFRLTESKQIAVRVDSINVLNHPQPGIPNYFTNFGGPFGSISSKSGSRTFQAQLRLTF